MKEWQVFHKSYWFKVGRSLGYMMIPFSGSATHLRGCHRPSKTDDVFEHICDSLKGTWDSLIWSRICPQVWNMVFYTPWFGFLNMSPIVHLLGQKVPIFEMSKNSTIFLIPQILEFWAINWHRYVLICEFTELFLCLVSELWSFEYFGKNKLSKYGMKGRQL